MIKELFNYGGYTFISQLSRQMKFNIDNLVVAVFLGLGSVTMFSIASRLTNYFRKFIAAIFGAIMPLFSQYEGMGDYKAIREKFIFASKISGYLSFFIGSILFIFGKPFIQRWMGPEYEYSYVILLVLSAAITVRGMQWPIYEVLRGISKHKFQAGVEFAEGWINLGLSILLVKKMGLIGVAYGTAIPMLIVQIVMMKYGCATIKLSMKQYLLECFLGVLLRASLMIGIPYFFYQNLIAAGYFNLVFLAFLQGIIFAGSAYLFGFNEKETRMLRNMIGHVVKTVFKKRGRKLRQKPVVNH